MSSNTVLALDIVISMFIRLECVCVRGGGKLSEM